MKIISYFSTKHIQLHSVTHKALALLSFIIFFAQFKISGQSTSPEDSLAIITKLKYGSPIDGEIPPNVLYQAIDQTSKFKTDPQIKSGVSPELQWFERGPVDSEGTFLCIERDPNDPLNKKVWAGIAGSGLWYNNDPTNVDSAWIHVSDSDFWESNSVTSISFDPVNPQTMFLGTGTYTPSYYPGYGIYKSTDGGNTFSHLSSTIPNSTTPGTVQSHFEFINGIKQNSQGHLFVTSTSALLRSVDGGVSWGIILSPEGELDNLFIDLDDRIYVTLHSSNNYLIYRSTDANGNNWDNISPSLSSHPFKIAYGANNHTGDQALYCMYSNNGSTLIKKSLNGGTTWSDIPSPSGVYVSEMFISESNNQHILIPNYSTFFSSTDGGQNWQSQNNFGGSVRDLFSIHNQIHYCSHRYGIISNPFSGSPFTEYYNKKGLRILSAKGVALKRMSGDGWLIGSRSLLNNNMYTTGDNVYSGISSLSKRFFFLNGDSNFVIDGNRLLDLSNFYSNYFSMSSQFSTAYDEINNIYYSYENSDINNNTTTFKKLVDIGGTNTLSTIVLPQYLNLSTIQAGRTANTLFLGTYQGQVFKITDLGGTNTIQQIDNGQLPNAYISSFDLGSSENEALISLSNFGVKSVWYTNNGGANWISKDEDSHGLPDLPVRSAKFFPGDPNKVFLGTLKGVYTTSGFLAENPAWEKSLNLPEVGVNDVFVRLQDSTVAVATDGRGFFIAPLRGYALPGIDLTVNQHLFCLGGSFELPFEITGDHSSVISYQIQLSDATGSFSSPSILGTGSSSPISASVPTSILTGSNYKLRIVGITSTSPITSNESTSFSIIDQSDLSVFWSDQNGISYCEGAYIASQLSLNNSYDYDFHITGPNNFDQNSSTLIIPSASISNQGSYTAEIEVLSCPIKSSSITLTHTLVPNLLVYSYPTEACPGSTVNLSATSTTKTSDPITYNWSGPLGFSSTLFNPSLTNVTEANSGVYSVTMTFQGGCQGTYSSTAQVNVTNSLPAFAGMLSSGNCPADPYVLNCGINGYTSGLNYSYSWAGPNGFSSTSKNPQVSKSINNLGTYTVTISYSGTCTGSSTATLNISSLQNVSVSFQGASGVCPGSNSDISTSLYYQEKSIQGNTYQWTGPNGFTSSSEHLVVNNFDASKEGVYSVTIAYTGDCAGTVSATTHISLTSNVFLSLSESSSSYWCEGGTVSINANSSNSLDSIVWNGPNNFRLNSPTLTIPDFGQNKAGLYSATPYTSGCNQAATRYVNLFSVSSPKGPFYLGDGLSEIKICQNSGYAFLSVKNGGNFSDKNISSISWTGPNGFSSSSNSIFIGGYPSSTGVYQATLAFHGCTQTATATTTVTVSEMPHINARIASSYSVQNQTNRDSALVCNSNYFYLDAIASNNLSISNPQWTGPNGFMSSSSFYFKQNNVSSDFAGTYTITGNLTGTCAGTASSTVKLIFNSVPKPAISIKPQDYGLNENLQAMSNCLPNATNSWVMSPFPSLGTFSENGNTLNFISVSDLSLKVKCSYSGCDSDYSDSFIFPSCEQFIDITEPLSDSQTHLISGSYINGAMEVLNNSNVKLDASDYILLEPGFKVTSGSLFKAIIKGCNSE